MLFLKTRSEGHIFWLISKVGSMGYMYKTQKMLEKKCKKCRPNVRIQ